jgi:SAM-dependent methyltransferase
MTGGFLLPVALLRGPVDENTLTGQRMAQENRTPPRRGSYGIDAPYAPAFMGIMGLFMILLALWSRQWSFLVSAAFLFALVAFYLHTTLRGKFTVWAGLLDQLQLRGDERLLDMGCGRGAVLLMAAQRLTTGRAVGVDLWRSIDQSGNAMEATQRNAVAEGVADRIELHTGDMTALPFGDNSFDVVLSSLAIHNISDGAGRDKAIAEAVRVLRPGGRLMITDIRSTRQYQQQLVRLGVNPVSRRRLGWRFWWGGPWVGTSLVVATKPGDPR